MPQHATRAVRIDVDSVTLDGDLTLPPDAHGTVVFAHGSGSSRHSPRNRYVAGVLNGVGLATLLLDLLTSEEERADAITREHRFDIVLLAKRLGGATRWLERDEGTHELSIGYFGASTGAAAALVAAAAHPEIRAVVSRGGRPDLAGAALGHVLAPTLLIVGSRDEEVIELNERARDTIRAHANARVQLEIVPGATHLFEEPGTLERVAELASDWFVHHMPAHQQPAAR